jgi:hypothetical protein
MFIFLFIFHNFFNIKENHPTKPYFKLTYQNFNTKKNDARISLY